MDFTKSRWFHIINEWAGLTAIIVSLIFFIIMTFVYIIRIRREPRKIFSFFTDDYRSTPTKILKVSAFLILAVGFVVLVYFNIDKMANGDPVVTTREVENTFMPSILFCSFNPDYINVEKAEYYSDVDSFPSIDLLELVGNATLRKGDEYQLQMNCQLFNDTLSKRSKEIVGGGGIYSFKIYSSDGQAVIYMGDFNMDPRENIHSHSAMQMIDLNVVTVLYTETRYVELDESKTYRSFQFSPFSPTHSGTHFEARGKNMTIMFKAPTSITINSEIPSLDLATFFGNFGGYLTICGIFGFLFGSGKVSPFGFVTDYCFPDKDKKSLMENLDSDDGNDSEKVNLKVESKNLLTEYYVDMELFSK